MVGITRSWLTSPLSILDERFHLDPTKSLSELCHDLPPHSTIPQLRSSLDSLPPQGSLVSFVGLVQDMGNPEMYYQRYGKEGRYTGAFRDHWGEEEGQENLEVRMMTEMATGKPSAGREVAFGERIPLALVSLPGAAKWVVGRRRAEGLVGPGLSDDGSRTTGEVMDGRKRGREDGEEAREEMSCGYGETGGGKRRVKEGEKKDAVEEGAHNNQNWFGMWEGEEEGFIGKRMNLAGPSEVARGSMAVTALLYDQENSFSLHAAVRAVGIVWYVLGVAPRLHVLKIKKLSPVETHPMYEQIALRPRFGGEVREGIIKLLTGCLIGDALAAEYCLMALASNVATRSAYATLGKLTLNLVLPPSVPSQRVIDVIDTISPRTVVVEVSMTSLNAGALYPRKDRDGNVVIASKLQVAPGTAVVMDETEMREGQLSSEGVKNLQALAALSTRRVVPLELTLDSTEMNTDCAVIILSRGKALTPADAVVYVSPNPRSTAISYPGEEQLLRMRTLMGMIGEGGVQQAFNIDDTVSKVIEDTFIEKRRQGLKDGEEALKRWMSVARALARSHGEAELSEQRWRQATEMEMFRLRRIPHGTK